MVHKSTVVNWMVFFCLFVFLFLPLLVCFVIVLFSVYLCLSVCLLPMW